VALNDDGKPVVVKLESVYVPAFVTDPPLPATTLRVYCDVGVHDANSDWRVDISEASDCNWACAVESWD